MRIFFVNQIWPTSSMQIARKIVLQTKKRVYKSEKKMYKLRLGKVEPGVCLTQSRQRQEEYVKMKVVKAKTGL